MGGAGFYFTGETGGLVFIPILPVDADLRLPAGD
jgi:hypothetical protein